jgi:uncharacterized surface protein with fasciclin (FAS1) repeats
MKKLATSLALAGTASMLAAGPAAAKGPGKPGLNAIAPGGNIVQVALAANQALGEFNYLLAAVGCLTDPMTGENPVVAALTGEDRLTLFAPTDQAFKDLQGSLGIAAPDPAATCALGPERVADVLTYHVTDGRRFANSLFNANRQKTVEMLNGEYLRTNPGLTLTDVAGQTVGVVDGLANINASNGVVHVIDKVLLPFQP